jgi:hypothetical protein
MTAAGIAGFLIRQEQREAAPRWRRRAWRAALLSEASEPALSAGNRR